MKRKVTRHGPVTLIISLPSKWVKDHNITPDSELDVQEQSDGLLIQHDMKTQELIADINTKDLDRTTLMYTIRGHYRLGYDTLNISYSPAIHYATKNETVPTINIIREEATRLIGYEIVHEDEISCVIKDLQSPSMKDFDIIVRRVLLLIADAMNELVIGIGNSTKLGTIQHKHDTITKFISYCMRMLSKQSSSERSSKYTFHIIASLDRLTDMIKYAARDLIDKKQVSAGLKKIMQTTAQAITDYTSIHYKYDKEKIKRIQENRYSVLKQLSSITHTDETVVATRMLIIMEMLLDFIEASSVTKK